MSGSFKSFHPTAPAAVKNPPPESMDRIGRSRIQNAPIGICIEVPRIVLGPEFQAPHEF